MHAAANFTITDDEPPPPPVHTGRAEIDATRVARLKVGH